MIFPKWGTLLTYGKAAVTKMLSSSSFGRFVFGSNTIFWRLNTYLCSSSIFSSWGFGLPFFSFSFSFSWAFLAVYPLAISFSFFFNFFYNFLSCCLDKPILSPSDKVSGSLSFSWSGSSSSFYGYSLFFSTFSGLSYILWVMVIKEMKNNHKISLKPDVFWLISEAI